jgi:Rps23 Pro-64 3,4-dihydroxylase Tpa1-like proline 4-hydroxylase
MTRDDMASIIARRLSEELPRLKAQYADSRSGIGHFFIDDVLPEDIGRRIHAAFPSTDRMMLRQSLREDKYVAAQMDQYDPLVEDAIYAFQDPKVVDLIGEICSLKSVFPDEYLYAGGISVMTQGQFLNPHLDNSHDKDRARWRVLNLLYYVTPDWVEGQGGNLELWPNGPKGLATELESKFNRLVVMATHQSSWHSVNPIKIDRTRCCVSNYYFSNEALRPDDAFHVTSFRGRPEQRLRDFVLRLDGTARMLVRKIFKRGISKPKHVYRK